MEHEKSPLEWIAEWRRFATESRRAAESCGDGFERCLWIASAARWDEMADDFERRLSKGAPAKATRNSD